MTVLTDDDDTVLKPNPKRYVRVLIQIISFTPTIRDIIRDTGIMRLGHALHSIQYRRLAMRYIQRTATIPGRRCKGIVQHLDPSLKVS